MVFILARNHFTYRLIENDVKVYFARKAAIIIGTILIAMKTVLVVVLPCSHGRIQ